MRTDPRYTRVRKMLTDEVVPRMKNGGLALCHYCQRWVYFRGGFLELLVWRVKEAAQDAITMRGRQRTALLNSAGQPTFRKTLALSLNNSDGRSP